MGKRFYDTEMFNKVWFRKLKPKLKTFWLYALCNCDIAGILELDLEASDFFIGEKITIEELNENFKDQLIKIDSKRYFIKDFVEFQNGNNLNPKSPVHQKIINILEKYRLWDRVSNRVCNTPVVLVEGIVVEKVGVKVEEEVIVEPPKFEVSFPFDSGEFMSMWNNWKNYLIEIKKPYQTFSSEQAALQFLSEFKESIAIEIIKTAIKNQWKNLRKPENESKPNNQNKRHADLNALDEITRNVLQQPFTFNDNYSGDSV